MDPIRLKCYKLPEGSVRVVWTFVSVMICCMPLFINMTSASPDLGNSLFYVCKKIILLISLVQLGQMMTV